MSAYPDQPVEVVGFSYDTDLHLTRGIEAVKLRRGKDADYVIGRDYKVAVDLTDAGAPAGGTFEITVPAGLLTDLSSVPRLATALTGIGRVGPHLEATIVHDWLYVAWQVENRQPTNQMRTFADDVFRAGLDQAKVRGLTGWLIYQAVANFGESAFFGREDRIFLTDPDPWPSLGGGSGPTVIPDPAGGDSPFPDDHGGGGPG